VFGIPRIRHRATPRLVAAAVLLAPVALAGCGGAARDPRPVVARVGADPITEAELTRAMIAVAPGPVPDPPRYTRCIGRLSGLASKGETNAVLRANCEQEHTAIVKQALDFLISSHWLIDEASKRGLHVSAAEVRSRTREDRSELALGDPRRGNEALAARAELSAALLRRTLAGQRRGRMLGRFVAAWRRRWTATTICAAGYVVDDCRGYSGFAVPEDPLALR
jgi:hypothetical protein